MEEVWKDIVGYEGKYQVSNMGRVKSLNYHRSGKEQLLRPQGTRLGYLQIMLCKGGGCKLHYIHRLVLMTFNPNPDIENLEVNHIDEDKTNNCLSNLEWCTRGYNNTYNDRHKKIAEKNTNGKCSIPIVQLALDGKLVNVYKSSMEAEREGGFNNRHINSCCKGRYKTHGGFRWCYLYEYISKIDPRIKKVILFDKEYLVN